MARKKRQKTTMEVIEHTPPSPGINLAIKTALTPLGVIGDVFTAWTQFTMHQQNIRVRREQIRSVERCEDARNEFEKRQQNAQQQHEKQCQREKEQHERSLLQAKSDHKRELLRDKFVFRIATLEKKHDHKVEELQMELDQRMRKIQATMEHEEKQRIIEMEYQHRLSSEQIQSELLQLREAVALEEKKLQFQREEFTRFYHDSEDQKLTAEQLRLAFTSLNESMQQLMRESPAPTEKIAECRMLMQTLSGNLVDIHRVKTSMYQDIAGAIDGTLQQMPALADKWRLTEKSRVRGTVKWFSQGKRYGWIELESDHSDVYVNLKELTNCDSLGTGDSVEFHVSKGDKGYSAKCVERIS